MPILFTTINGPAAISTDAYDINDAGQIVGAYADEKTSPGLFSRALYTPLLINDTANSIRCFLGGESLQIGLQYARCEFVAL
jgi:hypothetical protein